MLRIKERRRPYLSRKSGFRADAVFDRHEAHNFSDRPEGNPEKHPRGYIRDEKKF